MNRRYAGRLNPKRSLEETFKMTTEEMIAERWGEFMGRLWNAINSYADDRIRERLEDIRIDRASSKAVKDIEKALEDFKHEVCDDAEDRVEFSQEWYAVRIKVLDEWARRHGHLFVQKTVEEMYKESGDPAEFFGIIANGMPSLGAHPTYGQIQQRYKYRAEKAEKELAELKAKFNVP